jgi:hypothetical protein
MRFKIGCANGAAFSMYWSTAADAFFMIEVYNARKQP